MSENKAALEAEAKSETLRTFEHDGVKYTVEADSELWSVESMLAFEESKAVSVVRSILGPEQWAKYMATKPNNKDFAVFTELLFSTLGLSPGE